MLTRTPVEIIPEGYRKQSELLDWLPDASSLQDTYGKSLIKKLTNLSKKRESKMVRNLFSGTFFSLLGIISFVHIPRGDEHVTFVSTFLFLSFSFLFFMIGIILLQRFLHKGLWSKDEPNLRSFYHGPKPEEFSNLCDYWEKFLKSDYPIYASIGNNGLGTALNYKMREYGCLALIGTKKQRSAIFATLPRQIKNEWWFPDPRMVGSFNDNRKSEPSIIKQIIFHENEEDVEGFLVRLSALIEKEPTQKSRNARRRWIEIIRIVRINRNIQDIKKREMAVTRQMTEKQIELRPPSPRLEISKYYTYRDAEKVIREYLNEQHLLGNNLAKQLRTQLTQ